MERAAARFYRQAADAHDRRRIRKLLGDLAEDEEKHDRSPPALEEQILTTGERARAKTRTSAGGSSCRSSSPASSA